MVMSERGLNYFSPLRPPLGNWRFWGVQGLVVLAVGIFAFTSLHCGDVGKPQAVCILPITLYFIPLTYAAVTFGFIGSLVTAVWCVLLSLPVLALEGTGEQRLIAALQVAAITIVALFVGKRVDREMRMRWQAEGAEVRLRLSEAKYRSLFVTSPIPLLLVSSDGIVREANPAAGHLFARSDATLQNVSLLDILGQAGRALLDMPAETSGRAPVIAVTHGNDADSTDWVEPSVTKIASGGGAHTTLFQMMLRDVTEERRRDGSLRAYASGILRAQEEERRRIAQELHDETIQALIVLCRQVDAIHDEVGPLPSGMVAGLEAIRLSAEQIVQSLREFSGSLRPSVLEDLGLVASLRRLLEDSKRRTGIAVRFQVQGTARRLAADIEIGLFRIGQEALRNVDRHAQATSVSVRLAFLRDQVLLTVQDSGIGFTVASQYDFGEGLGILGMRERAHLLGGQLEIQSSPGRGTTVTVRVPIGEISGGVTRVTPVPAQDRQ